MRKSLIAEEDKQAIKLLLEAAEKPEKSFGESMKELFENMNKWPSYCSPVIYAHAGRCYLCCADILEPDFGKKLEFNDIICEDCKKWKT